MYNTFEKATFDQYLMVSLAKYTKKESTVDKYIDQLTGNGSLNAHFKKMFDKIIDLDEESLNKVLNDSMYPVLKIDPSNKYTFYPDLELSVMNNKIYTEDISENELLPRMLIHEGEFADSEVEEGKEISTSDTYTVNFSNDKIEMLLTPKVRVDISEKLFNSIIDVQVKVLEEFQGEVHENAEGKEWNIMSNSKLSELNSDSELSFYYEGNHYLVTNHHVKRTKVSKVYGLYLYKETYISYEKRNRKYCEIVMEQLFNSGAINTFKGNSAIKIIKSLKLDQTQIYLNHLLGIRDSKDLAILGFEVIRKGVTKDWSEGAVKNFMKYMKTDNELILAYKVSASIQFSLSQLDRIYRFNTNLLRDKDKIIVEDYLTDKDLKISEMNRIIGEITNSGRRQLTRKITNSKEVKIYRKLSHELQGHLEKGIINFSKDELDIHYEKVLEYQRLDQIMIKLIKDNEIE